MRCNESKEENIEKDTHYCWFSVGIRQICVSDMQAELPIPDADSECRCCDGHDSLHSVDGFLSFDSHSTTPNQTTAHIQFIRKIAYKNYCYKENIKINR